MKSSGRQSRESPASRPHPHLPSAGPQASHKESEEALQKRLDEVSRELCRTQSSHASLRADAEKAREQQQQMAGEGGGVARVPWTPDSCTCRGIHGGAWGQAWGLEDWPWGLDMGGGLCWKMLPRGLLLAFSFLQLSKAWGKVWKWAMVPRALRAPDPSGGGVMPRAPKAPGEAGQAAH